MTAFITCSLFLLSRTVHSESFLTDLYGKTPQASQDIYLDQGRVDHIEWGLSSDGTTANGAAILYISGSSTDGEWSFNYGDCSRCSPCDPVDVASDDYIIGYKIYYGDAYVFGLELYTYQGETFNCFDPDSISGTGRSSSSATYYNGAGDFYYLSGWELSATIDDNNYYDFLRNLRLQFTNIATVQPVVEYLSDSAFTASSSYEGYDPYLALYSLGGWSAASNSTDEWLSIDLGQPMKISSIGTKGDGTGTFMEWVTKYEFWSSLDGEADSWANLTLTGNSDQDTEKTHAFDDEPILAQYVRIVPLEWNDWPTMRVEVYGYDYVTAEYQPIATTMEPSGVERVCVFVGAVISFFAALAILF
mmetsp:Transcript_71960/g.114620  ORF Transcript_71960/g.114620 Transcript_71960/m.114620 type:complete len:361 (+) Transcript_71960:61-1143(+)